MVSDQTAVSSPLHSRGEAPRGFGPSCLSPKGSSHASQNASTASQTAVPEAPPETASTTAETTISGSSSAHPTADQPPVASFDWLKDGIAIIDMKRDPGGEAEAVSVLSLEGVTSTGRLFTVLREQLEEMLDPDETIAQIGVEILFPLPTETLVTKFVITSKASGKNRAWDEVVKGLQDYYDRVGKPEHLDIKIKSIASVRKVVVIS